VILDKVENAGGKDMTLDQSLGGAKITVWEEQTKVNLVTLPHSVPANKEVTLYIEAQTFSKDVRDIGLELSMEGAESDFVKATAVWGELVKPTEEDSVGGISHDIAHDSVLFRWADITNPPEKTIVDLLTEGVMGLRPIDQTKFIEKGDGVLNLIAFRWKLFPKDLLAEMDGASKGLLHFDQGRMAEGKVLLYRKNKKGKVTIKPLREKDFPTGEGADEESNDDDDDKIQGVDIEEIDESIRPSFDNFFYSMDTPGVRTNAIFDPDYKVIFKVNFKEYMRFGVTTDPQGSHLKCTRMSDKTDWHCRHDLIPGNPVVPQVLIQGKPLAFLIRSDVDLTVTPPEETDKNDIGTGEIKLVFPPN